MKIANPVPACAVTLTFSLLSSVASAQTVFYVGADAPPGGDGTTWTTALRYLQDALNAASSGDEIRVAGSVQAPDRDEAGTVTPGDRTATFQLVSGVELFGGYRGCPGGDCTGGDPNERNIEVYESRLTGDLGGDDVADMEGFAGCFSGDAEPYTPGCESFDLDGDGDVDALDGHIGENAYHVLTGSGVDTTAVLDGFTITGGYADGSSAASQDSGAAMYNNAGSPTLVRCRFAANLAFLRGGGVYNIAASPRLINCAFVANGTFHMSGLSGGGAMRNDEGSSPILSGCSFIGNRTPGWGGAISDRANCNPTLTDCVFTGNVAGTGGAVSVDGGAPLYVNCRFTNNVGDGLGGGLDVFFGNATLRYCRFEGNTAGVYGGAIATDNDAGLALANCTFLGNSSEVSDGGAIFLLTGGPATITNCRFFGNTAARFGGGMQGAASQLVMTNCIFSGNSANQGGGYMGWATGAPIMANCTFTGNTASGTGGGVYLIGTGNQTVANCVLWTNSDSTGTGESSQVLLDGAGPFTVSYSLIQGLDTLVGNGNVDGDPLFVDADGPDDTVGTEDDDLRIQPGSPCIDAADNTAVPPDATDLDGDGDTIERTPRDLAGGSRFVNDPDTTDTGMADPPSYPHVVDIGTYEFPAGGEAIPAVSAWGMVVMTLLLLASATLAARRWHLR